MSVNTRVAIAFWISLALVGITSPSLASSDIELVQEHPSSIAGGDVTGTAVASTNTSSAMIERGAVSQSKTNFSGVWSLNANASDDPREKLKEAVKAMKQTKGGGHGMGSGSNGRRRSGSMGRGMGDGRQGRGSLDGMGGRALISNPELSALIATAKQVDIRHEDPMLLIIDENDQRQRIFTDFRGSSVSASGGFQQRVSVAGWEGSALVVETTLNSGAKLTQNFQFDAKADQIVISAVANHPEVQPVSYRLVYDRMKHGSEDKK